jgi:hypothetical protein
MIREFQLLLLNPCFYDVDGSIIGRGPNSFVLAHKLKQPKCKGYYFQFDCAVSPTILRLYTPTLIIQNISIDSEGLAINVPA